MKELSKLEQIEDKIINDGILLSEISTSSVKAASIKSDSNYAIFFDTKKFENSTEEYVALAHEYYHVKENAFYTFDDTLRTMKRREFKANFALIQDLIPVSKLISLLSQNYNKFEIAEELTVTPDLIDKAFKIYTQKGMI